MEWEPRVALAAHLRHGFRWGETTLAGQVLPVLGRAACAGHSLRERCCQQKHSTAQHSTAQHAPLNCFMRAQVKLRIWLLDSMARGCGPVTVGWCAAC